jgi:hypothetical protein
MKKEHSSTAYSLRIPVLLMVFNRPETTRQVFNAIRNARPLRLYVAADGPRLNKAGETDKVRQVRELIEHGIDWDCVLTTLFREQNFGCRRAVSSAIDWFFEQEEEGIILEDDCLPHPTFFRFCQELLQKYRFDSRIMMISGNNFQFGQRRTKYSYYFSRYTHVWGWATWRRAWRFYDMNMNAWPELQKGQWLADILRGEEYAIPFWEKIFQAVSAGDIDTWDYQWLLSSWAQNGLSITPNCNLVSNIGFGPAATHTKSQEHQRAIIQAQPMAFPLQHPPFVIRDAMADGVTEKRVFKHTSLQRLYRRMIARVALLKQILLRS